MGAKILLITLFSLFMMGSIDIFSGWYRKFLYKREINPKIIILLQRLTFVILAFLFWRPMVSQEIMYNFSSTHFFFALFVYSFYRLIASFFEKKERV